MIVNKREIAVIETLKISPSFYISTHVVALNRTILQPNTIVEAPQKEHTTKVNDALHGNNSCQVNEK